MKRTEYTKWMPLKIIRKRDNKLILAAFHQWICNCIMVWDGKHQYLVNPNEDEILVPNDKESEFITEKLKKWVENIYTPKANVVPQQKFEVTEVKTIKEETPKQKVMTDFELLTTDIEAI
jgi:hypothetical protein